MMTANRALEEVKHLASGFAVEVAGRLIGKDECRPVDQRACHGNPLLLPPRKPVRIALAAVAQSHLLQEIAGGRAGLRRQIAGQLQGEKDVLLDRQGWDEIVELKDEADSLPAEQGPVALGEVVDRDAVNGHGPPFRQVDAADEVQKGRLARAAPSQEKYPLPPVDGQGGVAENDPFPFSFPVTLVNACQLDQRC